MGFIDTLRFLTAPRLPRISSLASFEWDAWTVRVSDCKHDCGWGQYIGGNIGYVREYASIRFRIVDWIENLRYISRDKLHGA